MPFDINTAKPVNEAKGFDLSTAKPVENDFSFKEMVSNVPASAGKMVGDIYQTVRHPIQAAKGLAKTATGLAQVSSEKAREFLPDELDFLAFSPGAKLAELMGVDLREHGAAFVDAIKERYGSIDKAKTTIEQDPVGALVDLSSVLSGTGLAKTGAAVNPINASANTAKYVAGKVTPKRLPKSMYESVAKFGTAIPEKKRSAMVDTALKYEIMPTSKGVSKLEGIIGGFNNQIDDLISTATSSGQAVPARAIYKHLKGLRQQKGGMSLDAPGDLRAINEIVAKFEAHLKQKGKSRLTPQELQELKVNTYKSINWDAKRMTGTPIKEDTYKAVARGAKEGVESMVPEVRGVNKTLGELYELQPHLQRAANRIENKNIISINDAPQVIAGTVAGGPAGAWLGAITAFLGKDRIKAVNAVRLQKLINDANFHQFLKNNPNISQAELMTILAGRQPTENDSK